MGHPWVPPAADKWKLHGTCSLGHLLLEHLQTMELSSSQVVAHGAFTRGQALRAHSPT